MQARQFHTKVISNVKIYKDHYLLNVEVPFKLQDAQPGQFVHIRVSDSTQPLLRRPLSIHRIKDSKVEIFYKVVGMGTKILSEKKSGEYLDIIGPLGNGFNCPLSAVRYPLSILVAGGMGIAPLIFLAEKLTEDRRQKTEDRILVLIGAKTKNHIFCEKEFKKLGCEVKVATEDGSRGFKGKITELLNGLVSSIEYQVSSIYACGPKPMLAELAKICQKNKIPAQVSLEEFMGCGIGACLGCAIKTKEGYKRVCKDGPVFHIENIIFE